MAFKHYRDCLFRVDDHYIFANNVSIDTATAISPVYKQGSKKNDGVNASNGVITNISVEYYLTGVDPIKSYINNQYSIMSGDFAGFMFPSGYLTKYNLNARPNSPVVVDSTITVFGDLKDSFTANQNTASPQILNYANATLTQMTSDYSSESFVNANNISYKYNLDLTAEYVHCTGDAGQNPYRVVYGEKTLTMSVESDNTKMTLPITGDRAGLILRTRSHSGAEVDTYTCSGVINSRALKAEIGSELRTTYDIEQYSISLEPTITGYSTSVHTPNNPISICGSNLQSIISAKIGEHYIKNIRYSSANGCVTGEISPYSLSGDLTVSTEWGEKAAETPIPNWVYPTLSVTGISPSKAIAGSRVIVSGANFYDISSVKFYNNVAVPYRVLSPIAIETTVPDNGEIGAITVTSSKRGNQSATSASFTPYPVISSLSTPEAAVGDTITLYGTNFANVSDVKFNSVSATTFNVSSSTIMSAQVPNGNNAGSVRVETSYGYTAYSPYDFWPTVSITGVVKSTDKVSAGQSVILLLNQTMDPQMLYDNGSSQYLVQFGNNTMAPFTLSTDQLQGTVPENAISGPVSVVRSDGASVYGSGFWMDITDQPPIIKEVFPTSLQKTGNTSVDFTIKGTRLRDIQNIFLFGDHVNPNGTTSTSKVTFTTSDFTEDIFSKTIVVSNNTLMASLATGTYDLVVSGNYYPSADNVLKDTKTKMMNII